MNGKRELLKNKLNGYQVQNDNEDSAQSAGKGQVSAMPENLLSAAWIRLAVAAAGTALLPGMPGTA
jgi:hypothetical protein